VTFSTEFAWPENCFESLIFLCLPHGIYRQLPSTQRFGALRHLASIAPQHWRPEAENWVRSYSIMMRVQRHANVA